ncbi:MAG: shikimate dehydrogenase [Oscillospiraceae bacterium]|nr:shikimate dehydrogenase [Oscillospiraceae bacterium]
MSIHKKYGLVGYPLGHSLSPMIHGEIFKRNGLSPDYALYEIPPEEFPERAEALFTFDGLNITIPYKEAIIPYCERLDESAEACKAVNCVKDRVGYNTDIFGFMKSIESLGADLSAKICLLGYGGAGKMIAYCAEKAGGNLTVAARNPERFKKTGIRAEFVRNDELKGDFDLLINATPVGMFPDVDECPVNFENIRAEYVFDLIYNPIKTKFLALAEESGAKAVNGLLMLVWQAVKSHEIWYGGAVSADDVQEIIKAAQEVL